MHQKYCKPLQNLLGVNVDNKYKHGKIYKICPINCTNDSDIYIGSTIQTLSDRMKEHINDISNSTITSSIVLKKYGVDNCNISLIELFPCNSRNRLFNRESFYIQSNKCVNKAMKVVKDVNDSYQFECIDCGYFTDVKCNIKRHMLSKEHLLIKNPVQVDVTTKYQCKICDKKYQSRTGLWLHKDKCKRELEEKTLSNNIDRLESIILEMAKNQQPQQPTIINNTNNNNAMKVDNDSYKFGCIDCSYFTNINCNIKRHMLSKQHLLKKNPVQVDVTTKYQCKICDKKYESRTGLWGHNQNCKRETDENTLSSKIDILENIILEMAKNQQPTIII